MSARRLAVVRQALGRAALACGAGLFGWAGSAAAAPIAQGPEFQVNTFTPGYQWYPDVAASPSGEFMVVWIDEGLPPGQIAGRAISARRFAMDGSAIGGQFRANDSTSGARVDPVVAYSTAGRYLVVWSAAGGATIEARAFTGDGSPLDTERAINTATPSGRRPSVASLSDGSFVVAWGNARARRLDPGGVPIGDEYQLPTSQYGGEDPSVAALANDTFVVTWARAGVQARAFATHGAQPFAPLGPQKTLLDDPNARIPVVAATGGAEFVVGWGDDSNLRFFGKRTTWNQGASPPAFPVSPGPVIGGLMRIAAGPSGEFVAVWRAGIFDPPLVYGDVYGRRFDSLGTPIEAPFLVNSHTTGAQLGPNVASFPNGDFVVTWWSTESTGRDIGPSVQARLFGPIDPGQIFVDGFASGDTRFWSPPSAMAEAP